MLSATLLGRTTRSFRVAVATSLQKRGMAGGHGPKPEWKGLDKTVRTYFPEDYQVAMAIMGFYGTLIFVANIASKSGKKKKSGEETPQPSATTTTTASGIPSFDSPDFDAFLNSPALVQLLESEDQLMAVFAGNK